MTFAEGFSGPATVRLWGVWIHDPLDPPGTAQNFPYGGPASSVTSEVAGEEVLYAGREFPVTHFGQGRSYPVQVSPHVPFGPEWADKVAALEALPELRRPLVFRDGRGRNITGTIRRVGMQDQAWGTRVDFTVSRSE